MLSVSGRVWKPELCTSPSTAIRKQLARPGGLSTLFAGLQKAQTMTTDTGGLEPNMSNDRCQCPYTHL